MFQWSYPHFSWTFILFSLRFPDVQPLFHYIYSLWGRSHQFVGALQDSMGNCNKFNLCKRANTGCNRGGQNIFKKQMKFIEPVFCISKSRVSLLIVFQNLPWFNSFNRYLCTVISPRWRNTQTRLFYPFSML